MKILIALLVLGLSQVAYGASCEDLDDKSMLRATTAFQEALKQGYDMSKIFDVTQGCLIPNPKNLRCVFFTVEKSPNTECPEQFPEKEMATVVCLYPDLSLYNITQATSACH